MAPSAGCLLLPFLFIASARIILVDAACGDQPVNPCEITAVNLCAGCTSPCSVPNPNDCASYYLCMDATTYIKDPFFCPDGEIFDQTTLNCRPDDGTCTPFCDQRGGGACIYTCERNPDGVIADPFDCSVYHQCFFLDTGPAYTCPADAPYFNGAKCGVDETACCHCLPYCYAEDLEKYVEDPTDCRNYFYCLGVDEVPTFQGRCEDGEHFDSHHRQCSSTAPCVKLCRNVVDENGCIDPYTCHETGFFPKCKTQCLREYYHCVDVNDDYAPTETCSDDLVFNPDTLQCTKRELCPYSHQYVPLGPVPA